MSGFFLMHRGWRDNPIFRGEFSRADAWVWLIENACWKPTRFDIRGKTVTLDRGQLCTSRDALAQAWKWSPSAVERFLSRLETEQMIERQTGQGRTIITIENYRKYQDREDETGQPTGQPTGQKSDSHRTAKEQGNKETREEEPIGSPSQSPAKQKLQAKVSMTPDWQPAPLPADVAELVAQWPPGKLATETAQFRDYWLDRSDKRPGWDRSFWRWLRTTHERVMRENRYGTGTGTAHAPRDHGDGFTRGLNRRIAGGGA